MISEDPKFSVIVPVHDVPEDVFLRCLKSIEDQDYSNLEVVIVPNADPKAEKIAKDFGKFQVVSTDKKGACHARNLGFENSTGEIVAFVNSDYVLKKGIISTWVNELQKHPECGFVYGAYEYRSMKRDVYPSKPFNVFELQNANYIDCGFPLWRKHVVPWDENIKSLQDWDFWLGVVGNGVKGHYLGREVSFVAEYPRPKGLSFDSGENWLERVKAVKSKHGIPLNDICLASLGAPNHAKKIAEMIGADYRDDTLHKTHEYKSLYMIGWYMKPSDKSNSHPHILRHFDKPGCKRIVHFVGADIYWLKSFPLKSLKAISGAMNYSVDHVLCENEQAQKELKDMGIESEIVPIPPYTDLKLEPLPKEFSVALYLTLKSDFDKYCLNQTLSMVKALPNVKFYGYGDADTSEFKAPNFEMKGNLTTEEWAEFVKKTSCYLRLVRHDTRPMATDEYLMAGRNVITNVPNPYVDYIDTKGDQPTDKWDIFEPGFYPHRWPDTKSKIVRKILEVKKLHQEGGNVFEAERLARSIAVRHELNKQKYIDKIRSLSKVEEKV